MSALSVASPVSSRIAALQLFTIGPAHIPRALLHMGTDRFTLARCSGIRFWKSLGTGDGVTFLPSDADLRVWGLFTVWDSERDCAAFVHDEVRDSIVSHWNRISNERATFILRPLRWKGVWSQQYPFGTNQGASADVGSYKSVTAALTRARIRPRQLRSFYRAVPPVAREAAQQSGLLYRVGIGEAPVGLQATFSVWNSPTSIDQFAYQSPHHQQVVRRTAQENWYAEELFARFAVESATGSVKGASMERVFAAQSP